MTILEDLRLWFLLIVVLGGIIGYATAVYLPFWVIFVWVGVIAIGAYSALVRTNFYGVAYMIMLAAGGFTVPMVIVYLVRLLGS